MKMTKKMRKAYINLSIKFFSYPFLELEKKYEAHSTRFVEEI